MGFNHEHQINIINSNVYTIIMVLSHQGKTITKQIQGNILGCRTQSYLSRQGNNGSTKPARQNQDNKEAKCT